MKYLHEIFINQKFFCFVIPVKLIESGLGGSIKVLLACSGYGTNINYAAKPTSLQNEGTVSPWLQPYAF